MTTPIEYRPRTLVVGQQYPLPIKNQGTITEFLNPYNELILHFPDLQTIEIMAVRSGDLYGGLLISGDKICFVWEFNQSGNHKRIPVLVCEGIFDVRLIQEPVIPEYDEREHLMFTVFLIDAVSNNLQVIRSLTLPRAMTQEFLAAVRNQKAGIPNEPNTSLAPELWSVTEPVEMMNFTTMHLLGQSENH